MRTWHRSIGRPLALSLLLAALSPAAHGAGEAVAPQKAGPRIALPGLLRFQLDLRPQLDEPFGGAAAYQRTIDRFAELTATMRRVCDDFARALQEALGAVSGVAAPRAGAAPEARARGCEKVARPYARAQGLGQEYLRIGREVARHHDLVRELDRLGAARA